MPAEVAISSNVTGGALLNVTDIEASLRFSLTVSGVL
jgi:hypothetical protein